MVARAPGCPSPARTFLRMLDFETYREILYREEGETGYIEFNFYKRCHVHGAV
ncbi:MAG: hypothetical protein ABDH29_06430 [Aquificaceae bacterium]